jgi:hypothetical protein
LDKRKGINQDNVKEKPKEPLDKKQAENIEERR